MMPHRRFDALALLLLWGVGLLPLYHQPQALLAYDPTRTGLIGLLALFTGAVLIGGAWRRLRGVAWVVVAWGGWMLLSALFSINPITGLLGDSIRRMGALPQAGLLVAALASALIVQRYGAQALARVAWWSGVVVSVVAMMQQARWLPTISPTYYPLRSSATIGYPTFFGSWIAMTVLLCLVFPPRPANRWARRVWWLGVLLIASALIPAGARAATLALAAGVFTLLLAWAIQRGRERAWHAARAALRRRIVQVGLVAVVLFGLLLSFTLIRYRLPLFQRLNLAEVGNATQDYRVLMWTDGLDIVRRWPALTGIDGAPDRLAGLRAWVGYGPDSQEQIYRLYPPLAHYTVDRAHTLWLDQLMTGGWLGLLARLGVVLALGGYALRRLGLLEPLVLGPMAAAAIIGALVAQASPWLPLVITFAAVGGLWAGLGLRLLLRPAENRPLDHAALLALAALVASLLDHQLGFESLAAGLAFWLTLGPLLARPTPAEPTPLPGELSAGLVILSAGLLARSLVFNAPNANARSLALLLLGLTLAGSTAYVYWLGGGRFRRRAVTLTLVAALLVGFVGGQMVSVKAGPAAALFDVGLFAIGSALLYGLSPRLTGDEAGKRGVWLPAAAGVLALGLGLFWWADLSGGIALRYAEQPATANPLVEYESAATLRPWDARTLSLFSQELLRTLTSLESEAPAALLTWANEVGYRAAALHPFDPIVTLRLARLETILAEQGDDTGQHRDRAGQLFDAALRQFPYSADAYVSRAYFTWMVLGEAETALGYVDQALTLDPTLEDAIRLRNAITAAS